MKTQEGIRVKKYDRKTSAIFGPHSPTLREKKKEKKKLPRVSTEVGNMLD